MWIDDDILVRCGERLALQCFVPEGSMVVLGASNVASVEANEEACRRDGIPILARYGGGGAVLLYPGVVVLSAGTWVRQHYQNKLYFRALNQAVIDTLAKRWGALSNLSQNGLSDIVFKDRKVAGTSLFRSRNYLLYQASLLVDLDVSAIERYLRHPSKEPDYRGKRDHRTFLTSLGEACPELSAPGVVAALQADFATSLGETLGDEWAAPSPDQFGNLLARAGAG